MQNTAEDVLWKIYATGQANLPPSNKLYIELEGAYIGFSFVFLNCS